jgi:glycosyltransferase involved in cell wall biosynthesis
VTVAPDRALRVLHVRDTSFLCGPGNLILEMMKLSRDASIDFTVASFGSPESNGFLSAVATVCPTMPLPGGARSLPRAAEDIARRVRAREFTLLHAHDFKSDALALMVAARTGVPVVTTVHGFIPRSRKARLYGRVDRFLHRRMARVIVVSHALFRMYERQRHPAGHVVLIRNCVDLDRYPFGHASDLLRRLTGAPASAPIIGHVGRLSMEKGQGRLIAAFARLRSDFPDARLVLAGEGPELASLKAQVAALGLTDAVHFLGYRTDIPDVFADLSVLVLNSDTEGVPRVVLEAMALGVPVIASAVGGTPEIVEDGETGILIPARDEAALCSALARTLTDRDAARDRSLRARRFVERECDMRRQVERTEALYGEVVGRGETTDQGTGTVMRRA